MKEEEILRIWNIIFQSCEECFGELPGYIPSLSKIVAERVTDELESEKVRDE